MKRVLVLGGGGSVGIAWEQGIIAGLLDEGVDVRVADLIVGTSAGSVVGTHLLHGRDPYELMEQTRERMQVQQRQREASGAQRDMSGAAAAFAAWAAMDEATPEACAEVGRAALAAPTMPEEQWLATFEANGWPGWPDGPLLITAVECETGTFRVFERRDRVPIVRAVAASCAVPGIAPPVSIEGGRYMDGGVRSGTSADLAQRIEPDHVLMIAPLGASPRGIGPLMARQIAREKGELEAAGASVHLVMFDEAAKEASGLNMMDASRAAPTADAGRAHGRRLAPALRDAWG